MGITKNKNLNNMTYKTKFTLAALCLSSASAIQL